MCGEEWEDDVTHVCPPGFRQAKRTSGWAEWADRTASLYRGCTNGCRYCFARANALRFGQVKSAEEWATPVLIEREAARKWGRCNGVIGFPGTHDITIENVERCEVALVAMLSAGNRVLIVTKPSLPAVSRLCETLSPWREQVEWRMTITGAQLGPWRYWEPNAPSPRERIQALRYALGVGFRASVSIEPMIDAENAENLARCLATFGAETIWIGKMNHVRQRVRIVTEEDRRMVERLERDQTDERIMELVRALADVPQVRWKDSIKEVIQRNGGRR